VELHISDNEVNDLRNVLDESGSRKRKLDEVSNPTVTMEAFAKITEEMATLREELQNLRAAAAGVAAPLVGGGVYAFDFDVTTFKALDSVGSLRWISDTFNARVRTEMRRHQKYFAVLNKIGGTRALGARSCAIFNKGENCDGHWHLIPKKPKREPNGIRLIFRNELRLHCCTICLENLGIMVGHPVVKCPWLRKATW
jgi:hypothetical protein